MPSSNKFITYRAAARELEKSRKAMLRSYVKCLQQLDPTKAESLAIAVAAAMDAGCSEVDLAKLMNKNTMRRVVNNLAVGAGAGFYSPRYRARCIETIIGLMKQELTGEEPSRSRYYANQRYSRGAPKEG